MGALSALGVVLTVRLAGEAPAGAGAAGGGGGGGGPLTVGLLLTFSRGALLAAAVGVVLVVLLAPTAAQLRGRVRARARRGGGVRREPVRRGPRARGGPHDARAPRPRRPRAARRAHRPRRRPAVAGDRPAAARVARRARAPPRRPRRRRRPRPRAGRHRAGGLGRRRQGGVRRGRPPRGWAPRARTAPTTGGWRGRLRATSCRRARAGRVRSRLAAGAPVPRGREARPLPPAWRPSRSWGSSASRCCWPWSGPWRSARETRYAPTRLSPRDRRRWWRRGSSTPRSTGTGRCRPSRWSRSRAPGCCSATLQRVRERVELPGALARPGRARLVAARRPDAGHRQPADVVVGLTLRRSTREALRVGRPARLHERDAAGREGQRAVAVGEQRIDGIRPDRPGRSRTRAPPRDGRSRSRSRRPRRRI